MRDIVNALLIAPLIVIGFVFVVFDDYITYNKYRKGKKC